MLILTCLGTKGIGVGTLALVSVGTGDLGAGCQISSSLPLYFLGLSCFSILNLLFEYILTRGVDPGEEVQLVADEVNDLNGLEATVVQTRPSSDNECLTFTTGGLLTAVNLDGVSALLVDSYSSSGDTVYRDEIGEPITAGASTVVRLAGVPAREAESEGATEIVTARTQERVTTMV
jgi:hypothetical protein